MKLEIIKDEKNNPIGWDLTGETQEEIYAVNAVRNMQFFGFDNTAIRYAGRKGGSKDNSDAGTLMWRQKATFNPKISLLSIIRNNNRLTEEFREIVMDVANMTASENCNGHMSSSVDEAKEWLEKTLKDGTF